jgi:putative sterol carrier protein
MADAETPGPDPTGPSAEDLAKLVSSATDEQLAEGMAGENRKTVLDEIFRRMAEHVNPTAAASVEAVVHWKILDRPDGGYDHYELVIDHGSATASDQPAREAHVTFKIPGVEFVRLVSGSVAGPTLFMSGKLAIEGDLMLATSLAGMFVIPGAS